VVLAAGAWSPTLVDLEDQCVSKVSQSGLNDASSRKLQLIVTQAWVFAHFQLTPQEAAEYKNMPVVYDGEYGFFFEPNE
jgi:sarcosine oxidase/L-pipecolate oxidase